jgi:hypothetical protein
LAARRPSAPTTGNSLEARLRIGSDTITRSRAAAIIRITTASASGKKSLAPALDGRGEQPNVAWCLSLDVARAEHEIVRGACDAPLP